MTQETPETKTVSSSSDFKQRGQERKGGLVELPSGLIVRCARPSINTLIAEGYIPGDVASALMAASESKGKVDPANLGKLIQLQRLVAVHSVLEPKMVDEPDYEKGEAHIDDLSDIDLGFILEYVQSGNADLAKFRSLE